MSYRDFSLKDIHKKFAISNQLVHLFDNLSPLEPSDWLKTTLSKATSLPLRSEKAKSESIVFPILLEVRAKSNNFITIYSGDHLNVAEKEGLKGECDFILAKDTGTFDINHPIIQVVEAKKHDIDLGVPQCAAQMVGAKLFNEQAGTPTKEVYGCVTTGEEWLFLKLTDKQLFIDRQKYFINQLAILLAIFDLIVSRFR